MLPAQTRARLTGLADGMVWERGKADGSVDRDCCCGDMSNTFGPWSFQPARRTEWARLLVALERHRSLSWLLPRAVALFAVVLERGWHPVHESRWTSTRPAPATS